MHFLDSEREANLTARKALELALQYNFVTELTSLIVVADDNFTLGNGPSNNGALDESLASLGGPVPQAAPDIAVRKFDYSSHVCLICIPVSLL